MSSRLSAMREPADDPEHRLTLRQADQACADLYATADELEFLKVQRAAFPTALT